MIQELVEFSKRVTKDKNRAFKEEHYSITLVIDKDGKYQQFIIGERLPIEAEVITAKKGKARFLLDKSEEVLGVSVDVSKLEAFKKRLELFKDIKSLNPVFKFYDKQNANGLRKAVAEYLNLSTGNKDGNITFMIGSNVLLAMEEVQEAINKHIKEQKQTKTKKSESLSVKETSYTTAIVIDENGEFQGFVIDNNLSVLTETISAKKKESYLLLGRDEDVLGITKAGVDKKHQWFLDKLLQYKEDLPSIEPVFKFYEESNENGLKKAISESVIRFTKDSTGENITFMVIGESVLLRTNEVRTSIIKHFQNNEKKLANGKNCSICGNCNNPVLDEPHGYIKFKRRFIKRDGTFTQISMGHRTGQNTLVSYNEKVFESYGLVGNLNSSICVECARNYIAALNYLESKGNISKDNKFFRYKHRIDISDSTIALFWTRENVEGFSPFDALVLPDAEYVRNFLNSVWRGKDDLKTTVDTNMFYCVTLIPSARTAVRDWTAIKLDEYKENISNWFQDIEIMRNNGEIVYSPLNLLAKATQKDLKPGEKPPEKENTSLSTIGTILWNCAIKGHSYVIPLEVLQAVLNRIWKGDNFSLYRAAVIKLVINRNTNKNMKPTLDESNASVAYLCGRLFAVIESMQWMAICNGRKDKKVNNGVKERFFVAAASQPAYIFGTLLTKNVPIYQHKIGGYLAKELNEIAGRISEVGSFPQRFSTIEQGEFALGYYFQRNHKNESTENN